MRRLTTFALAVLAGCASSRLETIDHRLQGIEEQEADTHKQLDNVRADLAKLSTDLADVRTHASDDLDARLDQLARDVAALQTKVAAPPPRPARPQPDAKDVYAVPVDGFPADGPADALVTIVRAADYACPFCERSRATMQELRARYPADVRIVYRDFVVHPVAQLAAQAACAAHKQGKFLDMEKRLFDEAFPARQFDPAEMDKLAGEIGLHLARFRADMNGPCVNEVNDDQHELARFGVGATPSFFINGHFMAGAQPTAAFTQVIDQELALAGSRVKAGDKAARRTYYATYVLVPGLKQLTPPTP